MFHAWKEIQLTRQI